MSDLEAPGGRDADLAYVQVAEDIARRIATGELAPGARLRSERELASYYEVSYGTIRRATKLLRTQGYISTVHGRGTFVIGPQEGNVQSMTDPSRIDRRANRGQTGEQQQ